MIDPKTAKRIRESAEGKILLNHLLATMAELDRVSDIKAEAPLHIAVEVRARQLAAQTLSTTLSPVVSLEEVAKARDDRDSYQVI